MYFYLYDAFLQDKKYTKLLSEIEARLIDLSIQGRTTKLNILNDIKELILDAVKHGAETVVVLGDDKTISKAIGAVVNLPVTLGIIPIGDNNLLAKYLGIPEGLAACEVLSKRVKEQLDLGKVGNHHFAFYLKALSPHIKIISANDQYTITPMSSNMEVYICNFRPADVQLSTAGQKKFLVPHDGYLEVVIKNLRIPSLLNKIFLKDNRHQNQDGQYTILPFKKIKLEAEGDHDVKLVLDDDRIIKPPVEIEVLPRKINLIVGRERTF